MKLFNIQIDWFKKRVVEPEKVVITNVPPGQISKDLDVNSLLGDQIKTPKIFQYRTIIPLIRRLTGENENFSQALSNVVNLTNAGFKLNFPGTEDKMVERMRNHIDEASKKWFVSSPSLSAGLNKLIAQAYISGAISFEMVVKNNLTGIDRIVLVKPEEIYFIKVDGVLKPFQKNNKDIDYTPLNEITYKYYAVNGDGSSAYGIPPYTPALRSVRVQEFMLENMSYIIEQYGLMGFMELMFSKPARNGKESDEAYLARLTQFLKTSKDNFKTSFREGSIAGFKDDHEFNFNQVTKSTDGITQIYENNEISMSSGLKQDPVFFGRSYNSSETSITVAFSKMMSEFKNINLILGPIIESIVSMELALAGYSFKKCNVEFRQSTLTDSLKHQQAQEIKIRNQINLYNYGITSLDEFADQLDYGTADQKKPRIPLIDPSKGVEQKQDKNKTNKKSDKVSRDKKKPQGTRPKASNK